jgi:hypothetical protein
MTHRRKRSWRLPCALVLLGLLAALSCCDNFDFYTRLDGDGGGEPGGELLIDPIAMTLHAGASIQFVAAGGVPPYLFRIASGSGTIDAETGLYTAPAGRGSAIVEVTDSASPVASTSAQVITIE